MNAQFQSATGVSPDGRTLVVSIVDPVNQFDIWAVPVDGGGPPVPVVRGPAWEDVGTVSPDGKWLALQSNETGQMEVYVQPFPGPGPARGSRSTADTTPCGRAAARSCSSSATAPVATA